MKRFEGKVVLVTGGNVGIGRATAEAFAREGARVVISARREVEGIAAVTGIQAAGGTASFVRADVAIEADVKALVEQVIGKHGRLDVVFNNAGIEEEHLRIADCAEDTFDRIMAVNVKGVWLCMKYQLAQMQVPYRNEPGGIILVPASQVYDVRMKLASAGLPKGSVVGYELMDGARFGQTQFQERLTFQRGLEGELTRSITALAAVQNARVHLALPNQNGFFREQQKPTASVMLTLYPGRTLERAQIAGIVHLVSSSVPEMNPKAVSVLDQTGALLTGDQANPQAGLDAQQLQYVAQVESGYQKRIFELLEPLVGRDNLRATVTADVDFSQSEATSEEFSPNQGKDATVAIRSQQVSESSGSTGGAPSGVPGAASNQPPVPATAPVSGSPGALQGAQSGGNSNNRRDATTNYEIDKTVRVTRNATGAIKRLNAAVVVNHRSSTDAKGKTTTEALPQAAELLFSSQNDINPASMGLGPL